MKTVIAIAALALASLGATCETVVLVGDSITAGACTDDPCEPFYATMQNDLIDNYIVSNLGVGGLTMLQVGCGSVYYEENIQWAIPGSHAQVMLGANDLVWNQTPAQYRGCLDGLVEKLDADGALSIVLIPPPPLNTPCFGCQPTLADYRLEALDKCATDTRVTCGPDPWGFMDASHWNAGQPVHPNQAGHDALAAAFAAFW